MVKVEDLVKGGSVVRNCACKFMNGREGKVWIQKIKNSNLIALVESLLSCIIEQEFINVFQIYSLVYY